jgi:hypothetical protein
MSYEKMMGGTSMPSSSTSARTMGALPAAGVVFAGSTMILVGIFQIFQGLAGLLNDSFFVVSNDYAYKFDLTAWSWIHLVVGTIVTLAGFYVFTGTLWARLIGIALAILSVVTNFLWIPYYPFWSLLIIAIAIVSIWGLSTQPRNTSVP